MAAVVRSYALAAIKPGRPHIAVCLGPTYVVRRQRSTKVGPIVQKNPQGNLAAFERGRGGRSSFSGVVATVFGASGFVGRYVVNRLGKIGSQVIIPYRCEASRLRHLKLAGDLGQILFVPFDLKDDEALRKSMNYSNVVINLIGRDYETRNFSFDDVHVNGAQRIARIAKEVGVQKLVHVSHLNAQPDPPSILMKGGSQFLQSKYYGEEAVRAEFPEAVIIRPADIYGHEDRFLNYYIKHKARVALWKKGNETIKMPVLVSNVAEGLVNAVLAPESEGQTYEFVGPHRYRLSELVDYMYRCTRRTSVVRTGISPVYKMKVDLIARMRPNPYVTVDRLSRESVSDKLYWHPNLEDLGVKPTALEDRFAYYLKPFRALGYYEESLGEIPPPDPPERMLAL